jgi:hypothetical protein
MVSKQPNQDQIIMTDVQIRRHHQRVTRYLNTEHVLVSEMGFFCA